MRKLLLCFVLAVATGLPAYADPKPAGCANNGLGTGTSCTFSVTAGNEGLLGITYLVADQSNVTGKIEVLRGSTVVYTSGSKTHGQGLGGGSTMEDVVLPAGNYLCRSTFAADASAIACSVA